MNRSLLFLLLIISATLTAKNQSYYVIDFTGEKLVGNKILLAYYFNGKLRTCDSLIVDTNGKGRFTGKNQLKQGIYYLYINKNQYYDFLIADQQHLQLRLVGSTDSIDFQLKGDEQSEAYNNYSHFISSRRKRYLELSNNIRKHPQDSLTQINARSQMKELDNAVINKQKEMIHQFNGRLLGQFLAGMSSITIPDSLHNNATPKKRLKQYIQQHYFDNLDLASERSWYFYYTPMKVTDYLKTVPTQEVDSITPEVIRLIEKCKAGETQAYRAMLSNMLSYASTSRIMGMDKLYMQIARDYYLSGKAPWADSTLLAKLDSEVRKIQYNLLGMKAYNLPFKDRTGKNQSLDQIEAPYLLLFFYEPSCGQCKTTAPEVVKVYNKYKSKGLKVLAFNTLTNHDEWEKFCNEYQLNELISGWDPDRQSKFWNYFDTSMTPTLYLLDKNKTIVAKKLDISNLDRFLDFNLP